ncbi:VWA domain-containing protein [Planctomycetota bacterium]
MISRITVIAVVAGLLLLFSPFVSNPSAYAEGDSTVEELIHEWKNPEGGRYTGEEEWQRNIIIEKLTNHNDPAATDALKTIYKLSSAYEIKTHILRGLLVRGGTEHIEFALQELFKIGRKDKIAVYAFRDILDFCEDEETFEEFAKYGPLFLRNKNFVPALPILLSNVGKQDKDLKILRRMVKNSDPHIAGNAIVTLCKWGDEKELKKILGLAKSKHRYVRMSLAEALSYRWDDPQSRTALENLTADEEWQVRFKAYTAMAQNGDKDMHIRLCDQIRKEEIRRIQFAVADIFKQKTKKDLGLNWTAWKIWFDKNEEGAVDNMGLATVDYFGYKIKSNRIVFIVDISGSMEAIKDGKNRLEKAKEELSKVVDRFDTNIRFNIIAFSDCVRMWEQEGLLQATKENKDSALAWVSRLTPGGGTSTYEAINAAFEKTPADTIYFLSDGLPSVGKYIYCFRIRMEQTAVNRDNLIQVHCIGLLTGLHDAEKPKYLEGAAEFLKLFSKSNFGEAKIIDE